jgi:hypothetical protein
MKITAIALLVLAAGAMGACNRDAANKTPKTAEGGTTTPSVPVHAGEKANTVTGGGAAAQAERGSGTSATNSAGTTTSGGPTSTGGTTR